MSRITTPRDSEVKISLPLCGEGDVMIYTVTMNPAIDCAMTVADLVGGRVNRASSQTVRFGGKGINISCALRGFGECGVLTGFTAGFTGDALEEGLRAEGFSCDFVRLSDGVTRINVKITSPNGGDEPDTELNGAGPRPTADELSLLTEKLCGLSAGDVAVLAGSLPFGVPPSYIRTVAEALPSGVGLVCDLSGNALAEALAVSPMLLKPNAHELFELLDIPETDENLENTELIGEGADELIARGAQNVLVSLGGGGAYYASRNGGHGYVPCPKPLGDTADVRSAVGCGDSSVAGWLCGMGFAGESARERALRATGIDASGDRYLTAARLAVLFGSASYYYGFPPTPDTVSQMRA